MNGEELFKSVLEQYATCLTYRDKGLCTPQDSNDMVIAFETHFRRPDSFRFRWVSSLPSAPKNATPSDSVIFTDGVDFTEFYRGKLEKVESLSLLAAGATGVSRSAVHMILNILLPEPLKMNHHWHRMSDIQILSDEVIDGSSCFHLVGKVQEPGDVVLWIDRERLTIRRLQETARLTDQAAEELNKEMRNSAAADVLMKMVRDDGMDEAEAKKIIEHIKGMAMGPREWTTVYDYLEVSMNEPADDVLFKKL